MQSKNAIGNLKNRYVAVLKKCDLLNVFGSLAVATALAGALVASPILAENAFAELVNTGSVSSMNSQNTLVGTASYGNDPTLTNNGKIEFGDKYTLGGSVDYIIGMYGHDAGSSYRFTFTNNGTLTVNDTSGSKAAATAYGMYALSTLQDVNTLRNTSSMTINASGGTDSNIAYAMYAGGYNNKLVSEANSSINVTATGDSVNRSTATAYGFYTEGDGTLEVANNGTLTVSAQKGESVTRSETTFSDSAYGIFATGAGTHLLANNGMLTVEAKATATTYDTNSQAYGIYSRNGISATVNNTSSLKVTSVGADNANNTSFVHDYSNTFAYGIKVESASSETKNTGTIEVKAEGGAAGSLVKDAGNNSNYAYAHAEAYGILAENDSNHTIINENSVSATALSGDTFVHILYDSDIIVPLLFSHANASALEANGNGNQEITNSSSLTAIARGGTATGLSTKHYASAQTDAYAYAMNAFGEGSHILKNTNGTIKVEAISGDFIYGGGQNATSNAEAYGLRAFSLTDGNHKLTSSGTVTVSATSGDADFANQNYAIAYGLYAHSQFDGSHTLSSDGSLNVTATSGVNTIGKNYAQAYGLYAEGAGNHSLTNKGTITVSSTSEATRSSQASPLASGVSDAFGMFAIDGVSHTLINNGDINATATTFTNSTNYSEHAQTGAYAMYARGDGGHTLQNTKNISARATGGYAKSYNSVAVASAEAYAQAEGMYVRGNGNHNVSSSGSIIVNTTGGYAEADQTLSIGDSAYADAFVYARGMNIDGIGEYEVANSGTITVTATGGEAIASALEDPNKPPQVQRSIAFADANARAYGINIGNNAIGYTVNNSGTISVTATGGKASASNDVPEQIKAYNDAKAYGIHIEENPNVQNVVALLTNTGSITAKASAKSGGTAYAYEVYSENNFTVDKWATTLRTWSENDTVFGLENGDTVTFANGNSGATLILRPGTAEQGFVQGQEYKVANMVAIEDGNGDMQLQSTIDGSIASVSSDIEFWKAALNTENANAPTVSLTLNEEVLTTPAETTSTVTTQTVVAQLQNIGVQVQKISKLFFKLFGATFLSAPSNNQELGLLDTTGMAAGSESEAPRWAVFATPYGSYTDNNEYDFNTGTFGVSAGASYSFNNQFSAGFHLDFNRSDTDAGAIENDLTSFALGVHGNYFINNNWYVGGSASYVFVSNDATYTQNIGTAQDDYSSNAFITRVSTGYFFEINENSLIYPEIGLSYLYTNSDDYTFHFAASPASDITNRMDSFSALYADFTLAWEGNYQVASGALIPNLGIGIRQNLTGSDVKSVTELLGSNYEAISSSDETTFLIDAGLMYSSGNFSIGAQYSGEFGSEQQNHTGSLQAIYRF